MPKKIEQIDAEYTQLVQQIGHKIYVKHQLEREISEKIRRSCENRRIFGRSGEVCEFFGKLKN